MLRKITYTDKEDILGLTAVDNKNKVTAQDMNDIKNAINDNTDELDKIKVNKSGSDMTGALNFAQNVWNKFGTNVAVGAINANGALGIKGLDGPTAIQLVTQGASSNTDGVKWTCNKNGDSTISGTLHSNFNGPLTGNADTATKLKTARTINDTSFDGTANITTTKWGTARNIYIADSDGTNTGAAVSVNGGGNATLKLPATIKASLTGNASTATTLQTTRKINGTNFNGSADITTANWGTARNITISDNSATNTGPATSINGSTNYNIKLPATIKASLTGNASTATTLQTARKINGTSFNGSADITTANWGTARNIYIADSDGTNTGAAVSVNGGGNATLKLPATIKASLTGNASTASKLATARNIAVSGEVTGSANFDGSGNISISTTRRKFSGSGTAGTSGYVAFAQLKITGDYTNRPTEFTLICRGRDIPCRVSISFANTNSSDPALSKIVYYGSDYGVFTYKSATSTWLLYYTKSESYDDVVVSDVNIPNQSITVTYPGTFITSKPTSNITNASLGYNVGYAASAGSSSTASKLATARTITLSGSVTGSANFDGSGNINISTSTNHSHSYLPLAGGVMTGNINFNSKGTSYIGNGANDAANGVGGALNNLVISSWWGVSFTTSCPGQAYSNTNAVSIDCRSGEVMAAKFSGPLNGNANTASKLASARNIALTGAVTGNANFDGSGNININTTVNHGHNYVPLSGGTMSGMLQFNAGFGIQSTVADNDFWRILGGGSSNNGYLEIATADDGSEPIYLRQYTGVFSNLVRTATLLDGNGNTSFPGTVSASSFNGNANTATKATQDSAGQQINTTYIKGLSVSGRTITYTKGDGSTGTITTQDNNTTYPIGYKTIDANFASKYRTETKGNTNSGDYISTIRNDTSGVASSPQFGTGLAWGRGDTHGYLYMNYSNAEAYLGAGNVDKLNWTKRIMLAGDNASTASALQDYNSTSNTIQIGYSGSSLTSSEVAYLAAYKSGGKQIKDVPVSTVKTLMGIKNSTSNVTCYSSNWSGSAAPYTNTINVTGVTASNIVEVGLNNASATDAQVQACMKASIAKITQENGKIKLYAYGTKPTVNIPMTVAILTT